MDRYRIVVAALATVLAVGPRDLWSQAPAGPGTLVPVEQGKLYTEQCGTGSPSVVLVHDGVVNSAVWDDVWPGLCRQFRVTRYDRRGYGRSPAATGWHSETLDLLAIVDQAGPGPVVLVASSHGGELAIDFTLQYPRRVEQLVLIGAVVSGFPYSDHFLNRGKATFEPRFQGDIAARIRQWAHDPYLLAPGHDRAVQRLSDLLTRNPQDLTHPNLVRPARPALPRLGEIRVPTLLLVGDADIPDVHAHAGAIEAGIPGAERIVVREAGHLLYLEHPAEFVELVTSFIRRHPR